MNTESRLDNSERKRVGLALGGGVVRGMAHLGVLTVLEEAGIPIDYVAGTSVGSIIAASYAAGLSSAQLTEYGRRFHWWRISQPVISCRGFICFDKLAQFLINELGDLEFKDLQIPCAVVATDLGTGLPVTLNQGRIATAIQASCSVPGFVTPVELDGRLLCDGGISDMLPVSLLREMGADYVIGVDIFTFNIRNFLGPFGYLLAALEILLERSGGGIDEADCLIAPELGGLTYFRISKRMELFELGRQATREKIDCIRSDLDLPASD